MLRFVLFVFVFQANAVLLACLFLPWQFYLQFAAHCFALYVRALCIDVLYVLLVLSHLVFVF